MRYFIGIDPGVHTGVAVWDSGLEIFRYVRSMTITGALTVVGDIMAKLKALPEGGIFDDKMIATFEFKAKCREGGK